MIVVMKPHASQEMIDRMLKRVEGLGMKPHVIIGVERTVIAATGSEPFYSTCRANSTIRVVFLAASPTRTTKPICARMWTAR